MTTTHSATTRLGGVASAALLVAAVYSLALVVAGFVAPAYQTASGSSSGEVTDRTDTLVGVNGLGAVIVLVLPLLLTAAVGTALWQRSWRAALPIAWTLTGLMAALNLLAMLSVGVFFLPITASLVVACSTRRPTPYRATNGHRGSTA